MARGDQHEIGTGSVDVWGPSSLCPQVGEAERFEMSCVLWEMHPYVSVLRVGHRYQNDKL